MGRQPLQQLTLPHAFVFHCAMLSEGREAEGPRENRVVTVAPPPTQMTPVLAQLLTPPAKGLFDFWPLLPTFPCLGFISLQPGQIPPNLCPPHTLPASAIQEGISAEHVLISQQIHLKNKTM